MPELPELDARDYVNLRRLLDRVPLTGIEEARQAALLAAKIEAKIVALNQPPSPFIPPEGAINLVM